jgi:isopentenyldiphosphate isomerase
LELWDVYDENRVKKNKTMIRGNAFEKGDYHLVIHVCIINKENKMLIQQRQPFKHGFSNLWDVTIGGSAEAGETSNIAASRELFEEIGLEFDFSKKRANFTVNFDDGFDDYYIIETDVDLSKLRLQEEEVQAVKWATKSEIFKMIDDMTFIPYQKSLISLIFEIYKYNGSITEVKKNFF